MAPPSTKFVIICGNKALYNFIIMNAIKAAGIGGKSSL